ncbi:hypothetical protein GPAL_1642 [Glaciecola pallidula DSM 14239 = ACAM 615]|uniref:Uncharacterized protein n=1 Tax=Brumicola pallidula DSM 14239 = ACAM 615 TaxID=1121922 RepID=K6YX02_9ALTE|nr:hypothetical protein GPAL_1642 [Glaciecola pallidula DSM 14239 = ACAM 615]
MLIPEYTPSYKISELLTRVEKKQGVIVNIREFHVAIIGSDSLPLTVLEEMIEKQFE